MRYLNEPHAQRGALGGRSCALGREVMRGVGLCGEMQLCRAARAVRGASLRSTGPYLCLIFAVSRPHRVHSILPPLTTQADRGLSSGGFPAASEPTVGTSRCVAARLCRGEGGDGRCAEDLVSVELAPMSTPKLSHP